MIYLQSPPEHRKNYEHYLKIIGSLSSLFSDSITLSFLSKLKLLKAY
jgi:hypothetical protein